MNKIYVNLATIPSRISSLEVVINCIYDQCDILNVYLNGFEDVPSFLEREKINYIKSQNSELGDIGDAGKFYWSDKVNGYYLTIDDDIIYPPSYVEYLIKGIDDRDKKIPVGIHGETFPDIIKIWTRDRLQSQHFAMPLLNDTPTCVLGTGCMGYHTSGVKVIPSDFSIANMADVWFTVLCDNQKIPRIVLKHPQNWLKIIPMIDSETLWGKSVRYDYINAVVNNKKNFSKEVIAIQSCLPWKYIYDPKNI